MADKKISALTAATTPLAGTEVLPIVQSGATVKVAVSDLTAGRAISATAVTASTGNFIVGTSGQGIDFSATPGTGTSELLADYEEGTWTPAQGSGLTVVGTFSSWGSYTKVGRLVTVDFNVAGSTSIACSAFGIITDNLPFTVGNRDNILAALVGTAGDVAVAGGTSTFVYAFSIFAASGGITVTGTYFV
jgi:hypothetical protein